MNLYLMRHANAGIARGNAEIDSKRALIKEGKEQCMLMALALGAMKVSIDAVVSSPLKRASQTAQLVATELGYENRVELNPALAPTGTYVAFQQMLGDYAARGCEGVLAVGHNPNLFHFLGRMITGNGGAAIRIRKGTVIRVDLEHHPPILRWLIDPRMARLLLAASARASRK